MNNVRTEHWRGYDIRFVEIDGEWWAILKDICDALKLRTAAIAQRLSPEMLERVLIETPEVSDVISNDLRYESVKKIDKAMNGKDIGRRPGENKTRWMLAVSEKGIYQALFASRKLEARKFQIWTLDIISKLRRNVGLDGYEVMQMVEPEIQARINDILDTLFWDDEKKMLMRSVTVQGGDVEQVPFK